MRFNIVDQLCFFRVPGEVDNVVGWELMGTDSTELPLGELGNRWDRERAMIIILNRHWKFWIYRVINVLLIVDLMALSLFTFDEDKAADRFGFIYTMLLTVVASVFIVKEYLPLFKSTCKTAFKSTINDCLYG